MLRTGNSGYDSKTDIKSERKAVLMVPQILSCPFLVYILGFEKKGTGGESITCNLLVFWNKTREASDLPFWLKAARLPKRQLRQIANSKGLPVVAGSLVVTDSKTTNSESVNEAAYEKLAQHNRLTCDLNHDIKIDLSYILNLQIK